MFYKYRRKLWYWRFNRAVSGILDTPPLVLQDAPWTFVSMVWPRDVLMYLLAIKSFYRRIGKGQVVAIITREAPPQMLETLRKHVPGIKIQVQEDIDTGTCQRGGCWERLMYVLDHAQDGYVVQLDADVLACGADLAEIEACIADNRSFAMADGQTLHSMAAAAELARGLQGDYVGAVAERLFDQYPGHENLRYLRGSAGLAGFAKGGFSRADMERFHREMGRLVGEQRWRQWGTEQCASNFAVANSAKAMALPHPAYATHEGTTPHPRTKCFHFIGTWRFDNGVYAGHGQNEVAALLQDVSMRKAA
ncbi:hypothetical protein [Falsiroseomonas sp.]|uniref:hypothetical protein n=1 Tax=Falsiroseomonas sp. TaxID=2870721 RepID=UPI002715B6DB|nr:hypothetical protein [Falsiroseomonas sp.]MDO9498824.1 hypothetical protein [Falsiroseomonas sp.]